MSMKKGANPAKNADANKHMAIHEFTISMLESDAAGGSDDTAADDFSYRRIMEMKSFMSCPDPGGCS